VVVAVAVPQKWKRALLTHRPSHARYRMRSLNKNTANPNPKKLDDTPTPEAVAISQLKGSDSINLGRIVRSDAIGRERREGL